MFHKRDNVQRRLVKIKKQESKTLKFLLKQEEELSKACEENNKLIQNYLEKETNEEIMLKKEVDELTKKRNLLEDRIEELRKTRVSEDHPLRSRRKVLGEKLWVVQRQVQVFRMMLESDNTEEECETTDDKKCIEFKEDI